MTIYERLANFFFEVGTMRKLPRMHRQTLLIDDISDTIASHSYRTALIAWHLAKIEKVDPYKTVMMALIHDVAEARTGDHNWIHKRYIKIFEDEIDKEQLGTLPYKDLADLAQEYRVRKSKESIVAKQADLLDQILLLREYEWQGSTEAKLWLKGKSVTRGKGGGKTDDKRLSLLLPSARKLADAIYTTGPSEWWEKLWTSANR